MIKYLFDPKIGLSDTSTQGMSGPGSNGNEVGMPVPQNVWTRASSSDGLLLYL